MDKEERRQELFRRYGREAVETGLRLQGEHFLRSLHTFDEVDQEWTGRWLDWIYGYMYNRGRLDDRTRLLVIIGEMVVMNAAEHNMSNHMRTALEVGVKPEEILEVILQASIYVGMPRTFEAMRVYRMLMNDLGYREYTEGPFLGNARDER